MSRRSLWVAATLIFLAACGDSPTSPSSGGPSGSGGSGGGSALSCPATLGAATRAQGTMTASIGGVPWIADCIGVSTAVAGVIGLAGSDLATGLSFQTLGFGTVRAVGTYTINELSGLNAILSTAFSGSAAIWTASLGIGTGTVIITSLTNNSIAGTFVFTLVPQAGTPASGTKVIANGAFNLTF